jgi:hypothetical protein
MKGKDSVKAEGEQGQTGRNKEGLEGAVGLPGTQWLPLPSERCTWKVSGSGRSRPS